MTGRERWRRLRDPAWLGPQVADQALVARLAWSGSPFAEVYRAVRPYTMCRSARLRWLYHATDLMSAAHLAYQRVVHGRRSWTWADVTAWTWADVTASEGSLDLRLYARLFPLLWAFSRLDGLLGRWRGFGLVASVRKRAASPPRAGAAIAGAERRVERS